MLLLRNVLVVKSCLFEGTLRVGIFRKESRSPNGERDSVLLAGSNVAEDVATTPAGDQVLKMRDPPGFPIQFVHLMLLMLK